MSALNMAWQRQVGSCMRCYGINRPLADSGRETTKDEGTHSSVPVKQVHACAAAF
jgi:hypothetical protein